MSGWMKSLQCKSNSPDDVVDHRRRSNPRYHRLHSHGCRNTVQSLNDAVNATKKADPRNPKPPPFRRPVTLKPADPDPNLRPGSSFSSMAELPEGHPSRNVVEIIFSSSWGQKGFPGRVETVLKVRSSTRTATRFEEYRQAVRQRAGGAEDHSRCAADGNEVMRFYCLGDAAKGGAYSVRGGAWSLPGGKMTGVCTFSGTGAAHANAGGGRGRRAMVVCRVIAGRVCKELGVDSLLGGRTGYDSVGGVNGELLVFDTRGLLPCFLIIYQL
ncbi:zinc finger (C2H2 type) family protein [Striga asiatica]|uniref:Zinc finger (C2H2 type) family protein n=1 Tax=Striga asiatica TaxID=4170 RepID=A0A5A7PC55_STRAF|nr:zinc finger (C2H2 type) family protein [Striga asiatica]